MLMAFELSGEHSTIPKSEVLACLESITSDFKIHLQLDGCLVIDVKKDAEMRARALSKKLSMTHHIMRVLGIGGPEEADILKAVQSSDIDVRGTYSIRVKRVREYSTINTELMEQQIGGIFYRRGLRADLKNPHQRFRVLLSEGKSVFGYVVATIDRSEFEARRPHHKPFFYPGVLMPRMARALVNIAKPGNHVFDPFCGTAGILVEAGLMGVNVIGGDVQRKLLLGAKMNLDHFHVWYSLMYQDACRLSLRDESIDAVVTDPPYGRSAMIKAHPIEGLLMGSLQEIHRVLKKGRRAVFISKHPIEYMLKETGFTIIQTHFQRVHKSLTRHIYVLEK